VHNYGPGSIKFSLKATMDLCPSSFARNGTSLLCHTQRNAPDAEKRYTECSAGGECVCKAPFEKPVLDVFPGLGFRDCGAEVVYIADDQASGQAPFVADSESVEADGWKFYAFNVTEDDFEVVATVAEKESSRVEIFAKVGAPPGAAAGQFDARSDWNPAMQRTHTIKLGGLEVASDVRTGLWFLGVYGAGGGGNFELGLAKYGCPGNCSSNGVCDDEQHKCACWDGYGGADCSIHSTRLEFNETVAVNTSAVFELEYYALPPVTDAMLQGNVEIIITAQFSSNRVNPHLDIRPSILLSLVRVAGADCKALTARR